MKILLIAGHGDGDCGATGNGYKEADLTREVATLLKAQLNGYADVEIADMTKNWYQYVCKKGGSLSVKGYDYALEIHFNAIKPEEKSDGATKGTEIYVTTAEKGTTVEQGIVNAISALGFKNRSVKRYNWGLINYIKKKGVSSALLEVCFIDDIDDMKLYKTKKSEIIKAIANGIINGFALEKKANELTEACNVLAAKGIINSPDYWAKGEGYSDSNTVLLVKKFASYVRGD
ncbi:MAG: N-acetylmuramoyl-L-alanine amidase [Clostridia bacterium]|nr:N-acetylmuramoyl-L-alanine amidase [Clostridia bacterium]MBQ8765968.1 N-acetylmuramoyl-L-alanine amidase [Clostridia bacterium]